MSTVEVAKYSDGSPSEIVLGRPYYIQHNREGGDNYITFPTKDGKASKDQGGQLTMEPFARNSLQQWVIVPSAGENLYLLKCVEQPAFNLNLGMHGGDPPFVSSKDNSPANITQQWGLVKSSNPSKFPIFTILRQSTTNGAIDSDGKRLYRRRTELDNIFQQWVLWPAYVLDINLTGLSTEGQPVHMITIPDNKKKVELIGSKVIHNKSKSTSTETISQEFKVTNTSTISTSTSIKFDATVSASVTGGVQVGFATGESTRTFSFTFGYEKGWKSTTTESETVTLKATSTLKVLPGETVDVAWIITRVQDFETDVELNGTVKGTMWRLTEGGKLTKVEVAPEELEYLIACENYLNPQADVSFRFKEGKAHVVIQSKIKASLGYQFLIIHTNPMEEDSQ